MPTLSIYLGESKISTLEYHSPTDFRFGFYPFSYPSVIKNTGNPDRFLDQVLKFLKKGDSLSSSYEEIFITSVSGQTNKLSGNNFSVDDSMKSIESYFWILAENFMLQTPADKVSYYPVRKDLTFTLPVMVNYLSNKFMYPSIVSSSPDTLRAEDVLTKYLASNMLTEINVNKPIVFTGGRFCAFPYYPVATYMLALDLLKNSGLFNVKIDISNKLPAISALNFGTKGNTDLNGKESVTFLSNDLLTLNGEEIFEDEFIQMGSVLVSPGGVECMFETDMGNSQFIELGKDELFIFPLEKSSGARIVASGKSIGTVEKNIKGGKLGLILDTRIKSGQDFLTSSSSQNMEWVKVINERISAF